MADAILQYIFQVSKVIVPMIIICGVITNSLNILVLTRGTLFNHACSQYLIVYSINNIFFLAFTVLNNYIEIYVVNITLNSLAWCKFFAFLSGTSTSASPYFIVLASIDRYFASSREVWKRRFSNVRTARWLIGVGIIFFLLLVANSMAFNGMYQDSTLGCVLAPTSTYNLVFTTVAGIIYALLAPLLMSTFGILTIWNINRTRIIPIVNSRNRRTELQMVRMLSVQIGAYLICNSLGGVLIVTASISPLIAITPNFNVATRISYIMFYISYVLPFFLYVLSSQIYRKELMEVGNKIFRRTNRIQVHPTMDRGTNRTGTIRNPAIEQ